MNTYLFNSHHSRYINDDMQRLPNLRSLNQNGGGPLPFMNNRFNVLGCQLTNTSIVAYRQGYISYYEKNNNSIGISFEFTGCAMAQFSYFNRTFIAHISLHLPPGHPYDTRHYWNLFLWGIANSGLRNGYRDFILFKPFDDTALVIIRNHGRNYSCCGIIDQQNVCYSAVISKTNSEAIQMWQRNNAIRVRGPLTVANFRQLCIP